MNLKTRKDFPELLHSLGLFGSGVEVGTQIGVFSEYLLNNWKCKSLSSIDTWKSVSTDLYNDPANVSQEEQDTCYALAVKRLSVFKERSKIIRATSVDAYNLFDDQSLDFVYIDARHDYASVKIDIGLWYPKVSLGGIIAGHDYINQLPKISLSGTTLTVHNKKFGCRVKQAVNEFFKSGVNSTTDDWPSWWVKK